MSKAIEKNITPLEIQWGVFASGLDDREDRLDLVEPSAGVLLEGDAGISQLLGDLGVQSLNLRGGDGLLILEVGATVGRETVGSHLCSGQEGALKAFQNQLLLSRQGTNKEIANGFFHKISVDVHNISVLSNDWEKLPYEYIIA